MRKVSRLILLIFFGFGIGFSNAINAAIKLPSIVSSNMVLQRSTTVQLWGWAKAKEKITIQASWIEQPLQVVADKQGNWKISIETTNSKIEQSIRISSKESDIQLENILFGEVWICSGQSNMQQPVKGFDGQPTFGSIEAISKSNNSNLRLFTVEKMGAKTPLNDLDKFQSWQPASLESVTGFSAVAYFFGQQLQEILDVPVGLIHTSWGGSSVQAWMSDASLSQYQEVNLDSIDITKTTNRIPTALFNAMINPIIPYTIKGALWYQGESNRMEPENYKVLFPAMVGDWRVRWDIGDFPFYYVQIAPFTYRNDIDAFQSVENSAFIREAQLKCVDLIPNSGIAITMDIGDSISIHPPKKKEVADRLLYNALNQTYGYKTVDGASPVYDSFTEREDGLLLSFKNAETGLYGFDKLRSFEIAGADKVFYPAKAQIIKRKKLLVSSDQVPNPVAVRYAWSNWVEGTLYDANLLPASSFRTDDWNDATRYK